MTIIEENIPLSCPDCGCSVVVCERKDVFNGKIRQHVNGGKWDSRTFLCGRTLAWIPNFDKVQLKDQCTYREEYKECKAKLAHIEAAIQQLQSEKSEIYKQL